MRLVGVLGRKFLGCFGGLGFLFLWGCEGGVVGSGVGGDGSGMGGVGVPPVRDPPILVNGGDALSFDGVRGLFLVEFSAEVREVGGLDLGGSIFVKDEFGEVVFGPSDREGVEVRGRFVEIRLREGVEVVSGGYKVLIVGGILEDLDGQVLGRVETNFVVVVEELDGEGVEGEVVEGGEGEVILALVDDCATCSEEECEECEVCLEVEGELVEGEFCCGDVDLVGIGDVEGEFLIL